MNHRNVFISIAGCLEKVETFLATGFLGLIVASIVLQILTRLISGRSFSWPEELSVILFIYVTFLGAGALYKKRAQIGVDYFVKSFISAEKQYLFVKIMWLLGLGIFTIILLGTLKGLKHAMLFTYGATIPIKNGHLHLAVIFMCLTNIFASVVFLFSSEKSSESASK
jgi:TRAP-type C4-dicarboxylate transport system permease small subunit